MRLAYGVGGPQKEKGGAGNEQPTSVVVQKNGVTYVATFFVAPHAGRIPGDPKNALFLSLIPGKTDAPVVPEPPKEVTPPVGMSTSATTGSGDPSTTTGGSGGAGAGGGNNDEPSGSFPSTRPGSCSCSLPGTESSSLPGSLGGLAALGLTIALISRRKEA